MVDLFIIHSGSDSDYVLSNVVPAMIGTNPKDCHVNILMLGSDAYKERYDLTRKQLGSEDNFEVQLTGDNWKKTAKRCIKRAQAVLVIVGNNMEAKKKTVGFEVEYARKKGKLILMHCVNEKCAVPEYLKMKDQFTKKVRNISKNYNLDEIRIQLKNYDIGHYDIFSAKEDRDANLSPEDLQRLIDQYKMYQKTSEDLVSRRQSVSSFYITVNGAIVTIAGMILGLVDGSEKYFILLAMAIVGIILDISWIKLLEAYGSLNGAKMKVISLIEKELPISLYDTEWRVMSDKLNKRKYVSFTDSEKRIPKLFGCIYILLFLASCAMLIYNLIP